MKKVLFPKILVVVLVLCSVNLSISAQDDAFSRGDKVAQFGVGLGSFITYTGYSTKIPPINGSIELGIIDLLDGKATIGVGGYLAHTSSKNKILDDSVMDFIIGPRGTFHYQFVDKLDTYAGFMVGGDIVIKSKNSPLGSATDVAFATFAGARYYITSGFAVYGEFGFGVTPLQFGLAFKF